MTLETIALDHLTLQELRTYRPALSAEEDRVSYLRSIVQALLDVLHTPGAGPTDRLALQAALTTDRVQRGRTALVLLASTVVPVLNERPRSRALLEALPDEVADAVAPLFPVTRRIDESDELHEAEWDVLVTAASRVRRDSSLNVVAFGSIIFDDLPYGRDGVLLASQPEGTLLSRSLPSRATELVVPPGVGDVLGMLVREDLAPGFEQQLDKQTLGVLSAFLLALAITMGTASQTVEAVVMPTEMERLFDPFLVLGHGGILAARYLRSAGWSRQSSEAPRRSAPAANAGYCLPTCNATPRGSAKRSSTGTIRTPLAFPAGPSGGGTLGGLRRIRIRRSRTSNA